MSAKTKILIAEHDADDIELLLDELNNSGISYMAQIVENKEDYSNALKSFSPDLILSEYYFPSFDGSFTFKIRQEIAPEIPFIFVTGTLGEEVSVAFIKNGVTDYVLKDKLYTLIPKLKRGLKESKEKQEKTKSEESNKFKAELLNTIGQAVLATDWNGIITFWNKAAEVTYGWTAEEAVGANVLDLIPTQQTKERATEIMIALSQGNSWSGEMVLQRKDGSSFTAWITDSPVYDAQHNLTGIIGVSSDLTERKKNEDSLYKANRLYSFISRVSKSLTGAKDEQILFDDACKIAVEQGKFKMAWIGIADTTTRKINLVASCGASASDLEILSDKTYDINGITEKVLQGKDYHVIIDIKTEPGITWDEYAAERGFISAISLPIKKAGNVIGTFDMYSAETNYFDVEEIKMLEEVAADISFGLDFFQKEKLQREAEELVVQSENRFRALTEKSTDMKTISTPEGEITYFSPSITKVLGYTKEEFLHASLFDLIHPDDIPMYREKRTGILEIPGKSFTDRNRFLHKNGNWIWCEGTVTNMLEESGIKAFVSNFRDISENKIIEMQREFDSNNLNALINNTADLMWSVDRDFNLITSNQPFDEMGKVNFGKDIVKGESVLLAAYSPEMLSHFKKLYERAFAGEHFTETEYFDYPVELWTEISYYPIRKGDKVIGTACHSRDITELKRSENMLKESEARLKEAQAFSHISNWEVDLVTGINTWSDEFYHILGIRREDVEPSPEAFLSYIHSDDFEYAKEEVEKTFETFESSFFNVRIKSKSETLKYVYSEWKFEFDKDNKPIRLYGILQDVTERKEAEENLKQSEIRFREFFDLAPESIVIVDINTMSFPKFNTNALELLKYSPEELIKLGPVEVSPPFQPDGRPSEEKAGELITKALMGEKQVFEWLLIDRNGKEFISEARIASLSNINGGPQLIVNFADITDRKNAEKKLVQSEARLSEAQAIGHICNWEINMVNNNITWSDELYNIFGINKDEMQPSTELFFSFIHPDDVDQVRENVQETLASLKGSSSDFRFTRNDGALRYAHMERKIEFDKDNKPIRLYGILQDRTEEKKAELIIIESEARLAEAQALAKIGNWETDLLTMNVIWSAETFRIFELNPDNFQASHPAFMEYVHLEDREKVEAAFTSSFDKESINLIEHRIVTSTGVLKMVEERWQVFHDNKGVPTWAVGTCQDITERKNAEHKLEQQNRELVKTNNELDHFVYSTSHDLRAPLTSVMGLIDLLESETLNENATDLLKLMKSCLIKSDDTIKEIIDYSRNSRFEIRKEKIDTEKLLEEIFESIALFDLSKQINKKLAVSKSADFYSDKLRLKIILSNIMFNAVKYSKSDANYADIRVDVEISKERALIIIKDRGIGIESGLISRVFEMFYRATESSTGSGLGLYITKECVEKLGGTIDLQSEFGVGTIISLNIPNLLTI